MKIKFLLLSSLIFVGGMTMKVSAASYADGIEYFKSGQPDRAKIILQRTFNDASTNKAEACYYLGEIYSGMQKNDSAMYYYKEGIKIDPLYPFNKIGEAKLMLKSNTKGAESIFKEILKEKANKKNPAVQLAIAKAYYENVMPEYQKYLDKAIDADKKFAETYLFQGDMLVDKKQYGDACGYYEMAISFDVNCVPAYVKYANIYFPINSTLAIQKLEDLKALAPNSAIMQRELAEAYYKNNQFGKAVDAYAQYMANPNHFDSDQPRYAALLFFDKKYDESLALVNELLKKDPNNFVLKRLAMYNYNELKQYDKALEAAKTFMPTLDNPGFTSRDYVMYGAILIENKQADQAIPLYEKALQVDTANVQLYQDLSDAYRMAGQYGKSADAYKEYMKRTGEASTMDYFSLGGIYYRAGSTAPFTTPEELAVKNAYFMEADSLFTLVAERAPEDYRGFLWRARANAGLDPETEQGLAKPYYEQAMVLLEKDTSSKSALVECYKYLGYYNYLKEYAGNVKGFPETRKYWNKVLEVSPESADIKAALDQLPK